jgi:hypothetical protein
MKILKMSEITSWVPDFRELSPEELKEAYALARASFTAEDLQRYTEVDEGIPAEEVLAELAEIQRQFEQQVRGSELDLPVPDVIVHNHHE